MTPTDPAPSPIPPRSLGLFRRTLRRHGRGIVLAWLLGSLGFCALAYVYVQPTYRAFSLIRVEPTVTDLYDVRKDADNLEPFIQTQVQLITSPNVLTAAGTNPKAAVLERIQKAGDVVQELQKAVKVAVRPNTYLIEVEMTSPNGYEAATIVNAVVDAFMDANNEWSDGMTRQQIKNLEQYQVDLKNQTDELERKWRALAAKGDFDVGTGLDRRRDDPMSKADPNAPRPAASPVESTNRASVTIEEYRQARQDLNAVELDLAQAQAWLTAAKDAAAKGDDPAQIDRQVERRFKLDPEVSTLLESIKKAEAKVSDASRVSSSPDDPAVKAAKDRLGEMVTQYKQRWDEKSKAIREMIVAGAEALTPEREVREADTSVKKLLARQASLKAKYEKLNVKNRTQATDAVEIALIQDSRQTIKSMMDAVTRRLEQLRYEAKGEARIRPVNPNGAMVPRRPISDHRGLVVGLIPFVMLFGAVGLFVGVEAWSDPMTTKAKSEPIREV